MARESRPADPYRVGAHLAEVFKAPTSAERKRIEGLHERFPLDPDLDARD